LLLRISDAARRPAGTPASVRVGGIKIGGGPDKLQEMPTEVVR
jgi:hypothetical protein